MNWPRARIIPVTQGGASEKSSWKMRSRRVLCRLLRMPCHGSEGTPSFSSCDVQSLRVPQGFMKKPNCSLPSTEETEYSRFHGTRTLMHVPGTGTTFHEMLPAPWLE